MSSNVPPNAQLAERGLWRALTRLDGFCFSMDPQLTGQTLKDFEKVITHKSWRQLTEGELAIRVAVIFQAACSIYDNEGKRRLDAAFYTALAQKVSKKKLMQNHDIYKRIIGIYVDGFKGAVIGSTTHVYVDRRSAPAALSVSSWLEITEGTFISITTKHPVKTEGHDSLPQEQPSRKRRAGPLDDTVNDGEIKRHKVQLHNMIQERDRVCRELDDAKKRIRDLSQEVKDTRSECNKQKTKLRKTEKEMKTKTTEAAQEKAEKERLFKLFKTLQRDRQQALETLTRQLNEDAREHITLAKGELEVANQARDQSQRKLAECAAAIGLLNTKLNGNA